MSLPSPTCSVPGDREQNTAFEIISDEDSVPSLIHRKNDSPQASFPTYRAMAVLAFALLFAYLSVPLVLSVAASQRLQPPAGFQVARDQTPSPRPSSEEAKLESLAIEGNEALYNLDYGKARKAFEEMTRLAPDQPAGYVYLANNLWLEKLNSSRRLSSSLYSSASFYSKTEEKYDLNHDKQFNALIEKAINVAESRLKNDPKDATSLYYKGAAVGIRAAYKVTVRRSFRAALGDANESIRIQKKVALKADYDDANLSIGFYEYAVDSLPFLLRAIARVVGITGSKKEGIKLLKTVVERGRHASDDARVLLIGIYARERRFEEALELISYLSGKYPRNYLFGIERATMLYRLNRFDEGALAFGNLIKDADIASVATDVVNYQYGEALVEAGNYASAIDRYKTVVDWPKSDRSLVTLAHLHAGKALDALGNHAGATREYKLVLKDKNVYDSHGLAKKYQEKPFIPDKK